MNLSTVGASLPKEREKGGRRETHRQTDQRTEKLTEGKGR